MFNYLDGFNKRMEIIGIVESIVNRKNRNMELERLFKDHDFINLVFSVLIYIMEKTLSEDSDCDREHILKFIETILPKYYGLRLENVQLEQVNDYVIKNVLQNEGVAYHFNTINYTDQTRECITIRLIADRVQEVNGSYKITYSLTDQGYDFLFRTKEIDQEIQITIEELKLKELIKRKNFKKAYDQSQNLIQMVRQKKKEIQILMTKVKENIHNVDIDEFEKLMNSTYELLNEEYNLLSEIMDMTGKSEDKIRQEYELNQKLDESLKKAQAEIKQINKNIKATLSEQKDLILSRQTLSKLYIETIGDSFLYSMENRFDIEESILKQVEQQIDRIEYFWKLVNPLFMPNLNKNLNVRSLYEPQGMIKLEEDEKENVIEQEVLSEDNEQVKIERINEIYVEIIDFLLSCVLQSNNESTLENIIGSLKASPDLFQRFAEDRLLFTTVLKLYDIGVIDLSQWRARGDKSVMNLSEEFNLEYCLYQLQSKQEYFHSIGKIEIDNNSNHIFEVEVSRSVAEGLIVVEKIEISNFMIKVEMVS
jgi:hypothetical protein